MKCTRPSEQVIQLEAVYHKALRAELKYQRMRFKSEHRVNLTYRGEFLHGHRVDLIVEEVVIVEVKALERLDRIHQRQLVSYLKACGLRAGLINFSTEWLKNGIRRVIL